ncbi:SRPBCC family protein [Saccharicrinis sp. FJH54]|uniref:SRPBCC family protein n=1 Tax=Saccharicrinis sp. FJH54 TaxID=3344665 RepID=UPI0035D46469
MVKFESEIKTITAPQEQAFGVLSDLTNIKKHLDRLPEDQIQLDRIEEDAVFFKVENAGVLGLRIIDKEPFKTIKFESVSSPVAFNLWIQLKEVGENDTKVKLTLKAEMSSVVKMMIGKHIKTFLDKLSDAIATYDFNA